MEGFKNSIAPALMGRKKAPSKEPSQEETECGVIIGDVVWCMLSNGSIGHGRITAIHSLNREGPAITIYDDISGGYRVGLVETIVEKRPTKAHASKLAEILVERRREAERR